MQPGNLNYFLQGLSLNKGSNLQVFSIFALKSFHSPVLFPFWSLPGQLASLISLTFSLYPLEAALTK